MVITRSRNGAAIRLTDERWRHIVTHHPEMIDCREHALETIAVPDYIPAGDFGELLAVRDYHGLKLGRFVVIVYREEGQDDGFLLTAYVAARTSSRRRTIWKR